MLGIPELFLIVLLESTVEAIKKSIDKFIESVDPNPLSSAISWAELFYVPRFLRAVGNKPGGSSLMGGRCCISRLKLLSSSIPKKRKDFKGVAVPIKEFVDSFRFEDVKTYRSISRKTLTRKPWMYPRPRLYPRRRKLRM